ncbi:MAG: DUF2189 domain-containing protein [Sphingomonadales bacterium]|nr:DUF2189 domain-containing protein [Sphingomonadales bacterium]
MASQIPIPERAGAERVGIRTISLEAPWQWLAKGWSDVWTAPLISLGYGLMFFAVSVLLTIGMFSFAWAAVVPAAAAGFMLVGPILAMGLYEVSRRHEAGQQVVFADALRALKGSSGQVRFAGVVLAILLLVWMRVATLLFALFFGTEYPPFIEFTQQLLMTPEGVGLLVLGTAIGAVFAFIVFATSAISIPMLLDRDIDFISAALASFEAVRRNWAAMLLWAWIIAVLMAVGIATFYIGLIVVFPLIGHATWHAYRAIVQ